MHCHSPARRALPWLLLGVGMLMPVVHGQPGCPTIPQATAGQVVYTTPNLACSFVPPAGVTSVSVVCVGGGGGAGRYIPFQNPATAGGGSGGGGGGALVYINNIPVTAGLSYPVQVGAGGFGQGSAGTESFFWNTTTMRAGGGLGGIYSGAAPGGTAFASASYSSRGAWNGGIGGSQGWNSAVGDQPGGGGGAGGYSGIGGNGGALGFPPLAGSGGGGGGGWSVAPGTITDTFIAGGGGGVGLLGFNGNSGAPGTADNRGGKAGSFGTDGALPAGGNLGGGAGGAIRGTVVSFAGGNGGCRVMWGPGRAYPSTNVADVSITPSPAPTPSPSPPPPPVVVPSPPPPPPQSSLVGQVAFTTPGFFRWTVPSGVTSVSVVCIGAGGGAGTYVPSLGTTQPNTASGGGGGGLAWANNIPVTAGEVTVTVGAPGAGTNSNGGDSIFTSNVNGLQVIGRGGGGAILAGSNRVGGVGGGWFVSSTLTSSNGFAGGNGGFQSWVSSTTGDISGGGGGAGGYNGPGGVGGSLVSSGTFGATQGQGGAGGGGWYGISSASGGGGGTGLRGLGLSGLGGTASSPGGQGGSGGSSGSTATASGGLLGGGAGGLVGPVAEARTGGPGGCRIMWGAGRSYPSTRTADEDGSGVIPVASPPPPPTGMSEFPPPITNPPLRENIFTGKKFQYMIGNTGFDVNRDIIPGVQVYNVDGFTTTAEQISAMKARGLIPICYVCVGTWEPFRPDTNDFPPEVIGLPYSIEPFTDEKWLDVRTPIVRQLIKRRFEMLARKGCVGVEPDNTNGYSSFEQGFPMTQLDWKDYIEYLSNLSRSLGMYFGLKNTHEMPRDFPEMVTRPVWDFVVDEGCYTRPEGNGTECDPWRLFKPVNKQVFQVMYTYYWPQLTEAQAVVEFRRTICPQQADYSSVSVLKTVDARSVPYYPCL